MIRAAANNSRGSERTAVLGDTHRLPARHAGAGRRPAGHWNSVCVLSLREYGGVCSCMEYRIGDSPSKPKSSAASCRALQEFAVLRSGARGKVSFRSRLRRNWQPKPACRSGQPDISSPASMKSQDARSPLSSQKHRSENNHGGPRSRSELFLLRARVGGHDFHRAARCYQGSFPAALSGRKPKGLVLPLLQQPQGRRHDAGLARIHAHDSALVGTKERGGVQAVSSGVASPMPGRAADGANRTSVGRHTWSPHVNRPDEHHTHRCCLKCGIVRTTRHENGKHWIEFHDTGGIRIRTEGDRTPKCEGGEG
jgi:hypothetical protein